MAVALYYVLFLKKCGVSALSGSIFGDVVVVKDSPFDGGQCD